MNKLLCTGLDGSNPLGFFAALGALEALSARGDAALTWRDVGGWRAELHYRIAGLEGGPDALAAFLDDDRKACVDDPALMLEYDGKQDLKASPALFREYLEGLVDAATPAKRRSVDWAGAFGSDVVRDNNGNTKPTALHFTAGQQQFLAMVRQLSEGTLAEDIRAALLGPWPNDKPLPIMGWDCTASRDYALRANNPSGDKKLGSPGADWLAVRGLSLLPVAPNRGRLETTGCSGGWKTGSFSWPLWSARLDRDTVRALLQREVPAAMRDARGIVAYFRCGIKRSDQGGYGTFAPATVV